MFVHVTLLGEVHITILYRTHEWSFFCVCSYMIKEIVPFPKQFLASFYIADENLRPSVSLGIKIFNETEFFGSRYYKFLRLGL